MSRIPRIGERARADVDHIFNWLVRRSVQGAISWYLAFQEGVIRIGSDSETFAKAPEAELFARDLRQALFKTRRGRIYRIVFEMSETEILILRVRGPGQALLRRHDLPKE